MEILLMIIAILGITIISGLIYFIYLIRYEQKSNYYKVKKRRYYVMRKF